MVATPARRFSQLSPYSRSVSCRARPSTRRFARERGPDRTGRRRRDGALGRCLTRDHRHQLTRQRLLPFRYPVLLHVRLPRWSVYFIQRTSPRAWIEGISYFLLRRFRGACSLM
jgi:hypothetical protein